MVDERRVRRLLQRVSDDVAQLERRARADRVALRADADRLAALKYIFLTCIEGCLDVAQHASAAEGWGPPDTNAHAMRLLGEHGVLEPARAESMARAVGFRNLLVHGYADIDDDLVVAHLDEISEFRGFVEDVSRWIDAR